MSRVIWCLLCAIFFIFCPSKGQKEDNENRPYKFGFNIEGYQHRLEEKDEKGIIMGEYGFITGDGVYHLTVYATDENGNFRIVRTKNFYVGLPTEKPVPSTTTNRPSASLSGIAGCSGCLIPTTSVPTLSSPPGNIANDLPRNDVTSETFKARVGPTSEKPKIPYITPINNNSQPRNQNIDTIRRTSAGKQPPISATDSSVSATPNPPFSRTQEQMLFTPPKQSAPPPLTTEELMAIFYKFNYTLTYHGHNEVGTRGGDKNGSYFFNGRDGFQRNVTYVANEFGYQPNITLINLAPEETPMEETEKENTQLLGNEFKFFYNRI